MGSDGDPRRELRGHEVAMGRSSGGSEVFVMDDRIMEAAAAHAQSGLTNINVTKTTGLHIGPKFVSITQNVENTEVVKVETNYDEEQYEGTEPSTLLVTSTHEPSDGIITPTTERLRRYRRNLFHIGRILGLELVSPQSSKRLRCSIAVFVCWAFVVATALTFFIFHFALSREEVRLDLDLPLPRYLWDIAKSTTKAERLSCAAALIVLFVCILLIVYFTCIAKNTPQDAVDVAPHEWYIDRDMWLAPPFIDDDDKTDEFDPLRLVIIAHTVSPECTKFINCAAELRNLQSWSVSSNGYDLSYNFLIGNDGRVYEARGWNVVGAHTIGYNRCSLGLAFIGDYRVGSPSYSKVTELQLKNAKMLLDEGVKRGHLHPYYHVLGAKDLKPSESPGTNLYNAIKKWPNYNHENYYVNKTCAEISNMYKNQTNLSSLTAILPIFKQKNSKL